jgi:hypothetical protein
MTHERRAWDSNPQRILGKSAHGCNRRRRIRRTNRGFGPCPAVVGSSPALVGTARWRAGATHSPHEPLVGCWGGRRALVNICPPSRRRTSAGPASGSRNVPPGPPKRCRTSIHIRPSDFFQLPAPSLAGDVSPPATPTNFSPCFLATANFR